MIQSAPAAVQLRTSESDPRMSPRMALRAGAFRHRCAATHSDPCTCSAWQGLEEQPMAPPPALATRCTRKTRMHSLHPQRARQLRAARFIVEVPVLHSLAAAIATPRLALRPLTPQLSATAPPTTAPGFAGSRGWQVQRRHRRELPAPRRRGPRAETATSGASSSTANNVRCSPPPLPPRRAAHFPPARRRTPPGRQVWCQEQASVPPVHQPPQRRP